MGKIVLAVSLASSLLMSTAIAGDKPAASSEAPAAEAAAYKPKTKHDNTPWRFNMEQDGERMTADQFDAWMKSKGVRVATGKPATADAVAQEPKKAK